MTPTCLTCLVCIHNAQVSFLRISQTDSRRLVDVIDAGSIAGTIVICVVVVIVVVVIIVIVVLGVYKYRTRSSKSSVHSEHS